MRVSAGGNLAARSSSVETILLRIVVANDLCVGQIAEGWFAEKLNLRPWQASSQGFAPRFVRALPGDENDRLERMRSRGDDVWQSQLDDPAHSSRTQVVMDDYQMAIDQRARRQVHDTSRFLWLLNRGAQRKLARTWQISFRMDRWRPCIGWASRTSSNWSENWWNFRARRRSHWSFHATSRNSGPLLCVELSRN